MNALIASWNATMRMIASLADRIARAARVLGGDTPPDVAAQCDVPTQTPEAKP